MTQNRPFAVRHALLAGISVLASASFSTVVHAQAAPAAANAATSDIVVTAQRREEKLSKVPVSIVAFGAEALKTRNITSEQDMASLVPGLQVKNGQNSNQLSFSLRGQTLDPFSGTSPAVLTYVNEAPYTPGNTATAFFDMGSIQVLKGPQGTLFGRNATGGAVLYSTPMPGDEFAGYVIARGASRDYGQIQAAIDVPLIKDVLKARFAFDATRGNGYITNLNTGNTLGDKNSRSGRATFVFTPVDNLKNTLIVQYDNVKGSEGEGGLWNYYSTPTIPGNTASQYRSDGTTHVGNTYAPGLSDTLAAIYANNNAPVKPGFFPGGVEGYAAFSHAHPYQVWLQYDLPHRAENFFTSNTTEVKIGDDMKVKNIFSYMKGVANTPGNLAGGPFGGLWLYNVTGYLNTGTPGGEHFKSETLSDELQVQGKFLNEKVNYTAGLFYSSQHRKELIPIDIGGDLGLAVPIADISYAYRNRETSKAIYAQFSGQVIDGLTATLGGRYTWETVGLTQSLGNVFGINPANGNADQSTKFSAPAWTFSLNYQIDPRNMIYFAQRGSFRSGNINGTVAPFFDPVSGHTANIFTNEYVHDFEVGYKFNGRIMGAPTQFNFAAYDEIVKHCQHALYAIVGGQPAGFTVNVPECVTKGIELDANSAVTDWLSVGYNLAYTDSKYTQGTVPVPFAGNLVVDTVPDSPKWSGSANVDIKFPVPDRLGKVDLRTDFYGQSHTYFSSTNGTSTPGTKLPGYTTLGMRLNWKEINQSRVSAAVYVRNLGDKTYYIAGYALGASSGLNTAIPGEPRTIGAELSVKF